LNKKNYFASSKFLATEETVKKIKFFWRLSYLRSKKDWQLD